MVLALSSVGPGDFGVHGAVAVLPDSVERLRLRDRRRLPHPLRHISGGTADVGAHGLMSIPVVGIGIADGMC